MTRLTVKGLLNLAANSIPVMFEVPSVFLRSHNKLSGVLLVVGSDLLLVASTQIENLVI